MISEAVLIAILCIYSVVLLAMIVGAQTLESDTEESSDESMGFSIIIPFRNEAHNLKNLLDSLGSLNYPTQKFEIFLINDNSEDDYQSVLTPFLTLKHNLNVQLMHADPNSGSPKKDAIQLAIQQARFPWILTTDADCVVTPNWLRAFSQKIRISPYKLIAGPVLYRQEKGLLSHFQYLDFLALQTLTAGGFGLRRPYLCSGANLAYSKSFFYELNGYKGNEDMVSGDDLFLLSKALKFDKTSAGFIKSKDALVLTRPVESWTNLLQQRLRWATKTKRVNNFTATCISGLGLIANLSVIAGFILALVNIMSWTCFGIGITLKIIADSLLIAESARFYSRPLSISWLLLSAFIYPLFVFALLMRSAIPGYQWKGRTFHV